MALKFDFLDLVYEEQAKSKIRVVRVGHSILVYLGRECLLGIRRLHTGFVGKSEQLRNNEWIINQTLALLTPIFPILCG